LKGILVPVKSAKVKIAYVCSYCGFNSEVEIPLDELHYATVRMPVVGSPLYIDTWLDCNICDAFESSARVAELTMG
jgi:hypothetical protein